MKQLQTLQLPTHLGDVLMSFPSDTLGSSRPHTLSELRPDKKSCVYNSEHQDSNDHACMVTLYFQRSSILNTIVLIGCTSYASPWGPCSSWPPQDLCGPRVHELCMWVSSQQHVEIPYKFSTNIKSWHEVCTKSPNLLKDVIQVAHKKVWRTHTYS